jgi:prepilin-type N-terminal cleavage/methylation domain-containing protein
MSRITEKGLTLIELLIVVAMIAILAAIAVPNFLEAQVRLDEIDAKAKTNVHRYDDYVLDRSGKRPEPAIAVENVCAWPNLTQTPDGKVLACIFNKPSHGGVAGGAIDCYQMQERGAKWLKIGVVAAPLEDPPSLRQHCSVGVAADGALVALTTGYVGSSSRDLVTPAWISRSTDGGKTWTVDRSGSGIHAIPYGDIEAADNGDLLAACYFDFNNVAVYRSSDDGKTWNQIPRVELGKGPGAGNETDILHLGKGEWIAVSRDEYREKPRRDSLKLYRSVDDGRSWQYEGHVTSMYQLPGDLTLLRNGNVLLTYGDRSGAADGSSRIETKISRDRGRTWSLPRRVADFTGDGGYPSSVELPDGDILTVYYSMTGGYHMGQVIWNLEASR